MAPFWSSTSWDMVWCFSWRRSVSSWSLTFSCARKEFSSCTASSTIRLSEKEELHFSINSLKLDNHLLHGSINLLAHLTVLRMSESKLVCYLTGLRTHPGQVIGNPLCKWVNLQPSPILISVKTMPWAKKWRLYHFIHTQLPSPKIDTLEFRTDKISKQCQN